MAQVDAQDFLNLAEDAGQVAVWDTESTGLNGDYNSLLVGSVKVYGDDYTHTFTVSKPGNDKKLAKDLSEYLSQFLVWVTFNGKMHDVRLLNACLMYHKLPPLVKRHHVDVYWIAKSAIKTSRKSQAHLLSFLETPEEKLSIPPRTWSNVLHDPKKYMPQLVKRCESDCEGLEALYREMKPFIMNVTK